MDALDIVVRRGGATEARHRVHAVAVQDGAVVAQVGDGRLVTFMRSSAKPLQALPLVRARGDLDEREVAIACASHLADAEQLAAVRSLLAKAPAGEEELECGAEGDPPARVKHNCSGKHAGMLALCRARGWDSKGYRLAEHPAQKRMLAEIAAAAAVDTAAVETAVDGCGVVTFALPLERMAFAFSRLQELPGGTRVVAAMRAHPALIRGEEAADTLLMRSLAGWIAKGGAEGLFCAAGPEGEGVALKVEDGNMRAMKPALAAFLARLGHELGAFARVPVRNSREEVVGEIVANAP